MRDAMAWVAFDCTPETPSTRGSITTTCLPAPPSAADGRGALEKRSFAAFRIASSRGIATGTGAGGGGGAGTVAGLGAGGGGGVSDGHAAIDAASTMATQ